MKIEIEKVVKVIKNNDEKLKILIKENGEPVYWEKYPTDRYTKIFRLFHSFMGDLYNLFGDECKKKMG